MPPLAVQYYAPLVGDWSGTLRMRVTDAAALRRCDRRTRAMGAFVRVHGRVTMATTLRRGPDDGAPPRFEHTTRVSLWGLPILRSRETIAPTGDRAAELRGVQRMPPGGAVAYRGVVEFADDAAAATYSLVWAGAPMIQRTQVVPEGLRLTQETAWSFAEVLLRRRA